jgi:hypothetical protein
MFPILKASKTTLDFAANQRIGAEVDVPNPSRIMFRSPWSSSKVAHGYFTIKRREASQISALGGGRTLFLSE